MMMHFNSFQSVQLSSLLRTHLPYMQMPSCPQFLSSNMSTLRLSSMNTLSNKQTAHRRRDSDELGVFEATQYFSGITDSIDLLVHEASPDRLTREEIYLPPQKPQRIEKPDKKQKQPTSPGARLATLLTSIFHHAMTSKRKSKPAVAAGPSVQDKEIHGGRNKRSSTSDQSNKSSTDSRPIFSRGGSGFWTPTLYPNTAVVMLNEMSGYPQRKYSGDKKSVTFTPSSDVWEDKRAISVPWLAEKAELSGGSWTDGIKWVLNECNDVFLKKDRVWAKGRKGFKRWTEEWEEDDDDDDGESYCSSDLFELKNYELSGSSGLTVYGTTDAEAIKRRSAVATAAAF